MLYLKPVSANIVPEIPVDKDHDNQLKTICISWLEKRNDSRSSAKKMSGFFTDRKSETRFDIA